MAVEIINAYIENCPACRFIGKRYTPADAINGSFGSKWGEWWQKGWFEPLDQLPHLPIVGDSTMAAMRVVNGELEYWIGFFCPAETEAPEGYEAVDISPRRYAVLWCRGDENNGEIYGLEAHNLCLEELRRKGWVRREDDWCFERYQCPRFTTPDAQGRVILDYGISVEENEMKAVIFDMDGLMFDTERVFVAAWDYVGEKMGLGKTGYMVMKTMGSNTEGCNRIWREEFGAEFDIDAMWSFTREFLEEYYAQNTVSAKPGLYDLLAYLKNHGYKLAVASSTKREKVEKHLLNANVRDYFDVVIGGDMVERSKPEPDIYLRAARELNVPPEECFALEDSRNGLFSAHRAGCKAIHVPDLWQPDDAVKQFILGPFDDLLAVRDWLMMQQ